MALKIGDELKAAKCASLQQTALKNVSSDQKLVCEQSMLRFLTTASLAGAAAAFSDLGLRLEPPVLVPEEKDDSAQNVIRRVGQTLNTAIHAAVPVVPAGVLNSVSEKITGKFVGIVEEIQEAEWLNPFGLPCDPNKTRFCHRKDEEEEDKKPDEYIPLWELRQQRKRVEASLGNNDSASPHRSNPYGVNPIEKPIWLEERLKRLEEFESEMEQSYAEDHAAYRERHRPSSESSAAEVDGWLRGSRSRSHRPVQLPQLIDIFAVAPNAQSSSISADTSSRLSAWRKLQQYSPAYQNVVHVSPLLPGAALHPDAALASLRHVATTTDAMIVTPSQLEMLAEATAEADRLTAALAADVSSLDPRDIWAEVPPPSTETGSYDDYPRQEGEDENPPEFMRQDARDFDAEESDNEADLREETTSFPVDIVYESSDEEATTGR